MALVAHPKRRPVQEPPDSMRAPGPSAAMYSHEPFDTEIVSRGVVYDDTWLVADLSCSQRLRFDAGDCR